MSAAVLTRQRFLVLYYGICYLIVALLMGVAGFAATLVVEMAVTQYYGYFCFTDSVRLALAIISTVSLTLSHSEFVNSKISAFSVTLISIIGVTISFETLNHFMRLTNYF